MSYIGAGAIGGIVGYYVGVKELLGIQSEKSVRPSTGEAPAEVETDTPAEVETDTPAEVETDTPAEVETDTPAETEMVAEDQLISRWPFQAGLQDMAGQYDASADRGNPTLGAFDGRNGISFDGDDALRVSRGGNEELNVMHPDHGPVTFSLWIYLEESDSGTIYIHETGMNIRTRESENSGQAGISFGVKDDPSWADGQVSYSMSTIPEVSLREWHHLAIVADSTNYIRMYINDGLAYSDDNMNGQNDHHSSPWVDITIGGWYGGAPEEWGTGSGSFEGKISDLRIYDTDLSPNQIQRI